MKTEWLKEAKTQEEREQLKETILRSKITLDILVKMLYNMLRDTRSVSEKDYDSPSWAFKQAHLNGKEEVIRSLIDLCDLKGINNN